MPYYCKGDSSFVEYLKFVYPDTSVYSLMRLVCVGCFVKQSKKKRHITVKKTNHPC